MKRNILKSLILPAISLLLITGCGEKEDYFETAKKNMQELKSYSMNIDVEMQMKTGGITINLPITLNSDVDVTNKISKMEISTELVGTNISSTAYVDGTDENNVIQYSSTDGTNWTKTKVENNNNQANNLVNADNIKEIKSDDKDYYVYEATLDKDKMTGIIGENLTNNDIMGSIDITNNITFKYYINKKTKYVEKIVAELNDVMNVTDEDSGQEAELTKLNFEIKFSNFNEVKEIVIPESAKKASNQVNSDKAETKTMKCHYSANNSGIEFDLTYFADYEGLYVTSVRSDERITSDNSTVLETYKKTVEETYSPFDNVEYYDYSIKIDGNTLISTTDINYSKIDIEKILKIDSSSATLIKNGKININDIKKVYETIGATCDMDY